MNGRPMNCAVRALHAATLYAPKCLCVLSPHPFHASLRRWLCGLYRHSLSEGDLPLEATLTLALALTLTLTRYAHVWNIVAQPDGSFHWLQSFINHYSLPSWLRQSDARSERHMPLASNPNPNPNPDPNPNPQP